MRDSRQKEHVVQTVNHERAEEQAHYPSLVLFEISLQRSVQRAPSGEQNKGDKQMSGTHSEEGTSRHPSVDEERNDGRRYHQHKEQRAKAFDATATPCG